MSQTASTDLAHAAKELGVEALSVLLLLTGKLDFENYISIAQADIARELKLRFQNVHRAMKKLISTGLIIPGPRSGKVRTYMLNPNFAWRGSTNTHAKALKASRKLRLVRPPPSKQRGGPDEIRDPYTVDWLTGKTDLEPRDTPPPPVNVRPSK